MKGYKCTTLLVLLICTLVAANEFDAEAEAPVLRSGTGLFPRQDVYSRPRPSSNIFEWMGSRLSKFPMLFRPRPAKLTRYGRPPHQSQSEVIFPDPPNQDLENNEEDEIVFDDDSTEPNENESGPSLDYSQPTREQGAIQFPQPTMQAVQADSLSNPYRQPQRPLASNSYHQQQFPSQQYTLSQQFNAPKLEVVKSQMISYNHHQQNFNLQPQTSHYTATSTALPNVAPFQNEIQHSERLKTSPSHVGNPVPVVPQSSGPDYFDTAYTSHTSTSQLNPASIYQGAQQYHPHPQVSQSQPVVPNYNSGNNYGATFHDIQQNPVNIFQPSANIPNYQQQFMSGSNTHVPQQHSPTQTQPQQTLVKDEPSVQIVSQGFKDGNPVLEILADADAPLIDGQHPFDLNKLIAMIEPGAIVEDSQLSRETRDAMPSTPDFLPGNRIYADLEISESVPEPFLTKGSTIKVPLPVNIKGNLTNLKEILQFFQRTGNKGYVIVDKRNSDFNTTETNQTDWTDEETDADKDIHARIKITLDNFPSQDKIPSQRTYPSADISFDSVSLKIRNGTEHNKSITINKNVGSQMPSLLFLAVRATTEHPNHNYYHY